MADPNPRLIGRRDVPPWNASSLVRTSTSVAGPSHVADDRADAARIQRLYDPAGKPLAGRRPFMIVMVPTIRLESPIRDRLACDFATTALRVEMP